MRPELQDMTVADWMQTKNGMNAGAFKQLVKIANVGGVQVPGVVSTTRNPRITFVSEDDSTMYQRVQDVESLDRFNSGVKAWSRKVEAQLKASANARFGHADRQLSTELPRLSDSIRAKVRFDKTYKLETRSVGFTIARHGVYLHQGAGSGYGGLTGSKWTDKYGTLKHTNPLSYGKQGTGERTAVHWFNSVIENNMEELIQIVADYSLDLAVNINSILLPE